MKKAIIYCRVSTQKQQREWESLENQESVCRLYCEKNSLDVIWVYKEAFTWKKSNRPVFNEAFKNAIKNQVSYFVVFDIDRFSREWFWIYSTLKDELSNNWIALRDSKNIIWESNIVVENSIVDMKQYKWNMENKNEMAEMVYSAQAKIEWNKIIQRTIPREIILEQEWYQVRPSNFWYKNKKISTTNGKKTIQIKDWIEWDWIIEMFVNRAEGIYSDQEIVDRLNLKWFKTRNWKDLTVKLMQVYIKKPIYTWIVLSKWTWNKPIKAKYEWLVSIETWNQANRWKVRINKIDNDTVSIEYNNKDNSISELPIIEKRKNYNSEYRYSKVLKCPICSWVLTGNTSKSRDWTLHYYYQCRWKNWEKHKTYTLRRNISDENIDNILKWIKINDDVFELFDKIVEEVYEERKEELKDNNVNYINKLNELSKKEKEITDNIDKIINFPSILEIKNKELEIIKVEKINIETKIKEVSRVWNLEKFKFYSKQVITHLDKLVLEKEKPELIGLVFDIVFDWRIEYEKISYHTQFFNSFSSDLSQQKNPSCDEFSLNSKWHLH